MFELLIAENIPETSETVPLIVVYLTVIMSLTSISIILTVFADKIHNPSLFLANISKEKYFFMTRRIGYLIGMKKLIKHQEKIFKENVDFRKRLDHRIENCVENFKVNTVLSLPTIKKRETSCCLCQKLNVENKKIVKNFKSLFQKYRDEPIEQSKFEWRLIALIIDRALFWIFSFLTFVSSTLLIIILPLLKHADLI